MKRVLSAITIIAIVALGLLRTHAQTATIDLSLSSIPLNPQPLQQVTITAQSYSTDLNQASLVWAYNGKTIASNTGQTQITITAPASGASANITLTASGGNFATSTATLVLRPASVDLLWEGADSYTPPFYKGRALPSTGGLIRVTAIPSISAPRDLSYNWSQNDQALQSRSGYDKSSIIFRNSALISTEHIAVGEASGNFSGSGTVDITPGNASVVGYLNTNGFIDYNNGSDTALNISGQGAIVHFEPYFFSVPTNISRDLTFSYTDAVGDTLNAGSPQNEFRLSAPSDGGQSTFNIGITTTTYSLQNITNPFSVNFN